MPGRNPLFMLGYMVFVLYVFLSASAPAVGQDCADYGNYAHWLAVELAGNGQSIAVQGDYAYLGLRYDGLKVIDVTKPSDPEEVGSLATGAIKAWDVAVGGAIVYIADHDYGIRVVDISDPENPGLTDSLALPGNAVRLTLYENHLYIGAKSAGMYILNVDDPAHPVQVGHLGLAGKTMKIIVEDSIAYVGDKTEMLKIVDVSDPAAPESIGCALTGGLLSVVKKDDYVYAIGGYDVYVVDVTDPTSPAIVDTTPTQGTCIDATIYGDDVFIAGEYDIVSDYSISNPTETVFCGNIRVGYDDPRDVACEDGYGFVATSYGLVSLELGNCDILCPIATCGPLAGDLDAVVPFGDHYAFGAAGNGNCFVFDISDPLAPSQIGGVYVSGGNDARVAVTYLDGYGDVGLVGGYGGVHVVDLSVPDTPVALCFVDCLQGCSMAMYGYVLDIAVDSTYAFATFTWVNEDLYSYCHLDVIDISNPSSAYIASRNGWCGDMVSLQGDYAYLGGGYGIIILDVTDPTPPVHVNTIGLSGDRCQSILVQGTRAYAGYEVSGGGPEIFYLQIFDATDPESLEARGSIRFESMVRDIQEVDGIAYVSTRNGGLFSCNVSDPDNPHILGALYTEDRIWDSALAGQAILIAGRDPGLEVAPLDCADVAGLPIDKGGDGPISADPLAHMSISPNPLRGATTLSFNLSGRSRVKLGVYDVRGTRVDVLVDRVLAAGPHTMDFDGAGLAPGVYLVVLESNGNLSTRKAVVLK